MKAPSITEAQLHRQVADYLSWALDGTSLFFHIPMGGSRHFLEAKNLKKLGSRAGIPDIAVLHNGCAFFTELKTDEGKLSVSQKYMIPLIEQAGCPVAVCRSLKDVIAFLRHHGVPLRFEPISTERIRRGFANAMKDAE